MAGTRSEVHVGSEESVKAIEKQLEALKLPLDRINTDSQWQIGNLVDFSKTVVELIQRG